MAADRNEDEAVNVIAAATEPQPAAAAARAEEHLNPTTLDKPAFLMSFPFSLSAAQANNVWMQELDPEARQIDRRKAHRQFLDLYHFMASEALIYLLPAPAECRLQDVVYTGNLGIALEHVPGGKTLVLSNFQAEARVGEADLGAPFFRSMGYDVRVPAGKFEGEADLKHLHDNVYIGGYGMRSDRETFEWMERAFDMKIIKVEKADEYLYHLDCSVFPITSERTLVCTELFDRAEVAEIERYTEIVDVSADECYSGICNSVRLFNTILNASHLHELRAGTEDYAGELAKNRKLEDIAVNLGFEVSYFNLSEYHKSGALLSCMVMHLNRHSYGFRLL
jgi:N-dimethylarginine dimethylaminohydrolase